MTKTDCDATVLSTSQPDRVARGVHPIEKLWREQDLPEWFLGNGGTNTKLYALWDAICALAAAPAVGGEIAQIMDDLANGRLAAVRNALAMTTDAHLGAAPAVGEGMLSEMDDASNACLELCAKHGFATGHGDTVADMIREIDGQIAERAARAVGGEALASATIELNGLLDKYWMGDNSKTNIIAMCTAQYKCKDALARPASPLRGITDEMVEKAARVHDPFAFDADDASMPIHRAQSRDEARKEVRAILAAALSDAAQPQYLANCKYSVSQCETYGQCLGVDCKNSGMAIVHRLCVEPKQDGIIYPEVDS